MHRQRNAPSPRSRGTALRRGGLSLGCGDGCGVGGAGNLFYGRIRPGPFVDTGDGLY